MSTIEQTWRPRSATLELTGFGLAVGLDDSIYVTGESFSKLATVRYLPDGTLEWSQFYDNPGTLSDRGYSVAVDPQDNVVVAAQSPLLTLHYSQGGSNPLGLHVGDLDGTSVRVGASWQATVTLGPTTALTRRCRT